MVSRPGSVVVALAVTLLAAWHVDAQVADEPGAAPPGSPDGPVSWVRHMQRYDGPLSQALREVLEAPGATATDVAGAVSGPSGAASAPAVPAPGRRGNHQVGSDSEPPVRQANPTVVASLDDPLTAVAAMNDSAGLGYQLLRTVNGGRTWTSTRQVPQLPTGEQCTVQTPSLAYSRLDHSYLLAVYCATSEGATSIQVWTSRDGLTWTAPVYAATVVSNIDPESGEPDPDVFYDWDTIAVDNSPGSPNFGRIYLVWTKFHLLPSGLSDYCPAQVGWADGLAPIPRDTTFTTTAIGPDGGTPGGVGVFTSAWTKIAVQPNGTVLAMFAQEDCNSGLDRHVRVSRSTDGGASFGWPVLVDQPGEFVDNPDPGDVLPDKTTPLGISPAMAVNPVTGRVAVVYQNNVDAPVSGADIWVSVSDDGLGWQGRPLSTDRDGAAAPDDQFFSSVTADPRGRWHALWLDNRLDPSNHLVDAWAATSRNDAQSWVSRRISTTSYYPDRTSVFGSVLGVVTAISASTAAVYPLWPDARDNDVVRTGVPELDVWTDVQLTRE